MARNRIDMDDLRVVVTEQATEEPKRKRAGDYLGHRNNALSTLEKVDHKKCLWIDPAECRIWERHDRFYELLNENNTKDLIDDFLSEGKQIKPAIVRPINDGSPYKWEVIDGARRHWVVSYLRKSNYPEFDFYVEPRALTDEQAFRLTVSSHTHKDISDFEKAVKYWKAINDYRYYKNQKEMAERLKMTESQLSRFLDLAEFPAEVVSCYPDVFEIKIKHAEKLSPLLKKPFTRGQLVEAASNIIAQQEKKKNDNKPLFSGSVVVSLLLKAAKPKTAKVSKKIEVVSGEGQPLFTLEKKGRGAVSISISGQAKSNLVELVDKLKTTLESVYQQ